MNKKWLYEIAGVALLLLILLALTKGASAQVNLTQNQTYNFTFTNASNQSASEILYCAAHNESFCAAYNLTMNLTTGDMMTRSNGTCTVTAICAAPPSSSNSTCVVQRTVAPGESFVNKNGACDLNITVTGGGSNDTTVPQRQNVGIRYDGNIIHLTVGNKTFDIPVSSNSFSYDQVIELECPVQPTIQATDDVDYLIKQCRSWVPMLDETISTLVVNTRTCSESAQSHINDIKSCGDKERDLLTQLATAQASAEANIVERDNAFNDVRAAEDERNAETVRADTNKVLAWIFGICFLISSGFMAFFVFTTRIRGGGRPWQ